MVISLSFTFVLATNLSLTFEFDDLRRRNFLSHANDCQCMRNRHFLATLFFLCFHFRSVVQGLVNKPDLATCFFHIEIAFALCSHSPVLSIWYALPTNPLDLFHIQNAGNRIFFRVMNIDDRFTQSHANAQSFLFIFSVHFLFSPVDSLLVFSQFLFFRFLVRSFFCSDHFYLIFDFI